MDKPWEETLDAPAILRGMIRRHKRLMVAVFLGVTIPLVPWVSFNKPPIYESTATIIIEPSPASRIPNFEFPGSGGMETAMIILVSRSLSEAVVEALPKESFDELLNNSQYTDYMLLLTNWMKGLMGKPLTVLSPQQRALAELQKARMEFFQTSRSSGPGPGVLRITGTASNPRVAMDLVNTHIQVLLNRTRSVNQEEAKKAREFLEGHAQQVKENLEQAEEALGKFQQQRGRIKLATQTEFDLVRLSQAENALAEVEASREVLQSRIKAARQSLAQRTPIPLPSPENQARFDAFKSAQERAGRLDAKLTALRDRYTDAHPLVQTTQDELTAAQARVAQLAHELPAGPPKESPGTRGSSTGQMDRTDLQRHLVLLESEDGALQSRVESLQLQVGRLRGLLRNLNRDEVNYSSLRRSVESQRNLLTILSDKLMGARIQEQGETSVTRIVDPASFPLMPTRSKTQKQILLILVLGGGLAIGAAFGVEFWRRPVETETDVQKATGLAVLGSVGTIGSPSGDGGGKHKAKSSPLPVHLPTSTMPAGIHMELYRAIRANVETERLKDPFRSILITSPGPGEGKSTTAINLAHVFHEFGRRVLVVEADLRRPSLHRTLNLPNKPGLVDYLNDAATFEQVCRHLPWGVTVIPGQTAREDPASMLAGSRTRELLEVASQHYDLILIDSAPVLAVPDNLLLVAGLDRVILVARASHTSTRDLRKTQVALQQANARILGVVLNQANPHDVHYYHPRYRKYYKTGEPKLTPEATRRFRPFSWRGKR